MERELAMLEAHYAAVLNEVRVGNRLRDVSQAKVALELAALIQAKTKRSRAQLAKGLVASIHEKLLAGNVTRDQWEDLRAAELRAGVDPKLVPPFEDVQELVVDQNWRPQAPQVLLVGLVHEMQRSISRTLADREWELMQTDRAANGGFITSDSPLTWGEIPEQNEAESEAKLTDPKVEVTFPLSSAAALVSYPGARRANVRATNAVVAHINSRTLFLSFGLVFFGSREFLLECKEGISTSSEYFDYASRSRKNGIVRP
jgi:hypothetical protein